MIPFYAEELGNINALRITLSVPPTCDVAKTIEVKNNVLTLDGITVADLSSVNVQISADNLVVTRATETSEDGLLPWEIKLSLLQRSKILKSEQTEVKEWWTSKQLLKQPQQRQFQCKHCSQVLVDASTDFKIKDLPSEHWYELIECWICHETKPEEHRTRMKPILSRADVILVGTTYFLIHPENIKADSIEVDPIVAKRVNWERGTLTKWIAINCSYCKNAIGEGQYCIENNEEQLLAVKLYKYCIQLQPTLVEQPTFTDFLVSDLVNTAKTHATHRFLIQGQQSQHAFVLIWLFNWDINIIHNNGYSNDDCCKDDKLSRERVIKVIYLDCRKEDEDSKKCLKLWLNDKSTDHLIYPDRVCDELVNELNQSNLILPFYMRKMNHPAMIFTPNFSIGFIKKKT
ncbi:ubiquitin-conjugating enzyme E2-binding protein [Cokeromyces recurvatus]|uniref:ubiquitin-conjugating enzyme E2-binding protein n=1 Tax=Cokeromyces recurvatus TaxID=90255 RepID=UPI00221E44B6|nr:ubiquitin-conjugating enzyme E2-binding protein [Cokeromyces recurvatus]KAI7904890.1 ubiquitin-conjugating enzyme E2-binding protein [Cokeromyces recurvatus]